MMKLVVLNGTSGIGKSTISGKLHAEIPMSVLLDIDELRRSISGYKEHRKESLALAYGLATSTIKTALQAGSDVIVDKAILDTDVVEAIVQSGKSCNADVYELILIASKETTIKRAEERGFRPGSLLTPERAKEMWEQAQELVKQRSGTAEVIDTTEQDVGKTYLEIKTRLDL